MRVYLGLGMRKTASFIDSLIPAVLKPDDLIKMNQVKYSQAVGSWTGEHILETGLSEVELELLKKAEVKPPGRILVLFAGGGREAIALAKQGYEVVGVDIVPEMVASAQQSARELEAKAQFYVQDASQLDFPSQSFDAVVAFSSMYGSIPTAKKRVEMLRQIYDVLKENGVFLFNFPFDRGEIREPHQRWFWLRKGMAYATLGNFGYQIGDTFYGGAEFLHYFSKEEIVSEAEQGWFEVDHLSAEISSWAIFRKAKR